MSISPKPIKEMPYKPPLAKRVVYSAKKAVEGFFIKPIIYLLYGSVACVMIGLLFKQSFPMPLYVIIAILGLIRMYDVYKTN